MGDGGGWGGDAPPVASKNLSPPLEPKIRDHKKSDQKRGKIDIFENLCFIFCGFLSEEMAIILLKNS